jgi:hypothetical protein
MKTIGPALVTRQCLDRASCGFCCATRTAASRPADQGRARALAASGAARPGPTRAKIAPAGSRSRAEESSRQAGSAPCGSAIQHPESRIQGRGLRWDFLPGDGAECRAHESKAPEAKGRSRAHPFQDDDMPESWSQDLGLRTLGPGPRARPDSRPANQGLTRSLGPGARSPRQPSWFRLRRVREAAACCAPTDAARQGQTIPSQLLAERADSVRLQPAL